MTKIYNITHSLGGRFITTAGSKEQAISELQEHGLVSNTYAIREVKEERGRPVELDVVKFTLRAEKPPVEAVEEAVPVVAPSPRPHIVQKQRRGYIRAFGVIGTGGGNAPRGRIAA